MSCGHHSCNILFNQNSVIPRKKRPTTKSSLKKITKNKYNYNRTVKGQKFVMDGWMDGQNRQFHMCGWYHLHKKQTDTFGENNSIYAVGTSFLLYSIFGLIREFKSHSPLVHTQ